VKRWWLFGVVPPDPLVGAGLALAATCFLAFARQLGELPGSLCVIAFCGLVAIRRWRPVPLVLLAGALIALPAFTHNLATVDDNGAFIPIWASVFLYSYTLGSCSSLVPSIVGLAGLIAGINLSAGPFNPVPEMLTLGPWLGGLMVASRRRAATELEQRAKELEEEREVFARESVRYERARLARELHDIVAHCVSLMVVQANAGERLASVDREGAAEAFASIGEAARQAEDEIGRLVEMLGDSSPASPSAGLRIVEELVGRAQASGLDVSCHMSGDIDDLTAEGADGAYRLVQEGITNAMKHAPGAPLEITVQGHENELEVRVVNGPARHASSGLERAGGHNGLAGMRERIVQCGGTFNAGVTAVGGWQVTGLIPRHRRPGRIRGSQPGVQGEAAPTVPRVR
jgi:signal transduction histidine kinase